MVRFYSLAGALPLAAAWPVATELGASLLARQGDSTGIDLHRGNTGVLHPAVPFDAAAQYVNVMKGSGHEFIAPTSTDKRGECPGLNAAANHGFLNRNGIQTIASTVKGLEDAYNMSPEVAQGLAVISILLSGDILAGTWSIGTGYASSTPLLSNPRGLTGLHNKYEGDASIVRGDAYLNGGNVGVFQYASWVDLIKNIDADGVDNLSLHKVVKHNVYTREFSKHNNPYYWAPPFPSVVTSAAHNFVVNFMSNHSAAVPTGTLTKSVLKSFFAVTGDSPKTYKVHYGQERIPENWYKRPGGVNRYDLADVFADVSAGAIEFPGSFELGGNTGKVDSFVGIEPSDLTGGTFSGATLFQGNNLACFFYRAAQQGDIDGLDGALQNFNKQVTALTGQLSALFAPFTCPELHQWNSNLFNIFPGYKYTGPANSNSK